jgi:hypothetical protein
MKYPFSIIIILFILSLVTSADSAPPRLRLSDIITPQEKRLLVRGDILTYAKMTDKGDAFRGA